MSLSLLLLEELGLGLVELGLGLLLLEELRLGLGLSLLLLVGQLISLKLGISDSRSCLLCFRCYRRLRSRLVVTQRFECSVRGGQNKHNIGMLGWGQGLRRYL